MDIAKLPRLLSWLKRAASPAPGHQAFDPGRRAMLRTTGLAGAAILLGGVSNLIPACGVDEPPIDDSCKIIDTFEDGNLTSEAMTTDWEAMPGSTIITQSPFVRVEGSGSRQIGITLRPGSAYPYNQVGDWDTLFVDVKVGRVSDPESFFDGAVVLWMEGLGTVGFSRVFSNNPVASWVGFNQVTTVSCYYPTLTEPTYSIRTLTDLRIYLAASDSDRYFIEIDNVRVCRTGE